MKNAPAYLGIGLLSACHIAAETTVAPAALATATTAPLSGTVVGKHFLADFLPPNYRKVVQRNVTVDGEQAEWSRYQPALQDGLRLGEAHFSVVWSEQGYLKGFADIRLQQTRRLPDKMEAQAAADAFLQQYAPDLLHNREVDWIDRHEETLRNNGQTRTLSGMKVKMRNRSDGRWFWVIIGSHGRPIIFERDIVWINFPGKRQTEKWLHDDWLAQ